ncbi:MAG TPA: universal stress protein, partial [Euzebya sp.]|nr:universal stress protein [Euzebya sp.]
MSPAAPAVLGDLLVPLDGSARAEMAIDVALQLAACGGGAVTLLVVTEADAVRGLQEYASAEQVTLSEAAETYLRQCIDGIATTVRLRPVTISGTNAAEEILAFAEADGSSMIIMT